MDRQDILAYIAMTITVIATVVLVVAGIATENLALLLMSVAVGLYVVTIGVNTSVKRQLKQEIKEAKDGIESLHALLKADQPLSRKQTANEH